MAFGLREFNSSYNSVNTLGFSFLPYNEGMFKIHHERVLYFGAYSTFGQILDEDLRGWKYELDKPEEGFFEIKALDKTKKEVLIKFKVKFKLKEKNGNGNTGISENMKFEGIFHEIYEENKIYSNIY